MIPAQEPFPSINWHCSLKSLFDQHVLIAEFSERKRAKLNNAVSDDAAI
jgi:hypothetical protein